MDDSERTVILRRKHDVPQLVNFIRSWDEYVHGFGDLNTEFWYGLRNIHCLTSRQQVDLQLFEFHQWKLIPLDLPLFCCRLTIRQVYPSCWTG